MKRSTLGWALALASPLELAIATYRPSPDTRALPDPTRRRRRARPRPSRAPRRSLR